MTDYYAGSGEEDLGIALSRLQAGDRVFIAYADYTERYPSDGENPNELDEIRMSELSSATTQRRYWHFAVRGTQSSVN